VEDVETSDQFPILATSSRLDDHARVLKHGDTFAVFDQLGDVQPLGLGEQGLYHEGTRHLSRLRLSINGRQPLLLSSTVLEDNSLLTVDMTNPDLTLGEDLVLGREVVHLLRSCFLWSGSLYAKLRVRNYALHPVDVALRLTIDADFADIFEVRGTRRRERGQLLAPEIDGDQVLLQYRGLDGVTRQTRISFAPAPDRLTASAVGFVVHLGPHAEQDYHLTIDCKASERTAAAAFEQAKERAGKELASAERDDAVVSTTNAFFNGWLNRSAADLHMMVTRMETGPYPYAGVPWFSTVFGRDGIITALEYLWVNPDMARGVLNYLAANQASTVKVEQDAEPGKILHETRRGEMAALGEIPFGKYYGSVDATPLFVILAGAYYDRTADRDFVGGLWPHVERALSWIDTYGDPDGDGLCEYARQSSHGLVSQGWKDSFDAIFHADGSLAEGPIALVEVQGYVYAAQRSAARLAEVLGDYPRAKELWDAADRLQERFEHAFWCDDLSTYALALDCNKRPCRVRASNAGHCLFSGIASAERAAAVAHTLLDEASFSGWGIRTVATTEARYNPMAYHNGSVWPHDNALVASGFARYGLYRQAARVLGGLFDASTFFDLHRMPELFCGFSRRSGEGPTLYPVACSPQSWSAGAVFLMLQACLGLSIDASRREVRFCRPSLPESLSQLTIENLRIGDASADLTLERYAHDVGISVTRKEGDIEIIAVK
jgi:glycogen debranching enzyme